MNKDLHNAVTEVVNFQTLLEFMRLMQIDWENAVSKEKEMPSNPYGPMQDWENINIGTFIESAAAWAADTNADTKYENKYRMIAQMLLAGKFYD